MTILSTSTFIAVMLLATHMLMDTGSSPTSVDRSAELI